VEAISADPELDGYLASRVRLQWPKNTSKFSPMTRQGWLLWNFSPCLSILLPHLGLTASRQQQADPYSAVICVTDWRSSAESSVASSSTTPPAR